MFGCATETLTPEQKEQLKEDRPKAVALAQREFLRTADEIAEYCVGLIEQSDPSTSLLTSVGYTAEEQSYGYSFYQEWKVGLADVDVELLAKTSPQNQLGCVLVVTPRNSVVDTVFGRMDDSYAEQAIVGSNTGSVNSLADGRNAVRNVWTRELERLGYTVSENEEQSVAGQQLVSGIVTGVLTGGLLSATSAETNVQIATKDDLQIKLATSVVNQAQSEIIRFIATD